MLVTKHFVYLHTMKTGGHWVRALITRWADPSWQRVVNRVGKGQHRGYTGIPDHLRHLPVIAAVRNPWDWWVSWFFFMKQKPPVGSTGWVNRFRDCPATPDGFLKALPRLIASTRTGEPSADLPPSHQWRMFIDEHGRVPETMRVIRYENLREELLAAIAETGAFLPKGFLDAARLQPRKNVSKHEHYSRYYPSEDHVALVAERERRIIDRFGYTFEAHP